jgi:hypothetical protein
MRYLGACMFNMSFQELQESDWFDFAALWARGAVGAAR